MLSSFSWTSRATRTVVVILLLLVTGTPSLPFKLCNWNFNNKLFDYTVITRHSIRIKNVPSFPGKQPGYQKETTHQQPQNPGLSLINFLDHQLKKSAWPSQLSPYWYPQHHSASQLKVKNYKCEQNCGRSASWHKKKSVFESTTHQQLGLQLTTPRAQCQLNSRV